MDLRREQPQSTGTDQYQIQQAGPQVPVTPVIEISPYTEDN